MRRHRAHYDVTGMMCFILQNQQHAETECGKLNLMSSECLLAVKWEFYRDVCMHDICAGTTQSACPYLYALAKACAQAGVDQDWISLFPECKGKHLSQLHMMML